MVAAGSSSLLQTFRPTFTPHPHPHSLILCGYHGFSPWVNRPKREADHRKTKFWSGKWVEPFFLFLARSEAPLSYTWRQTDYLIIWKCVCAKSNAHLIAVQNVLVVYWHSCVTEFEENSNIQSVSVEIINGTDCTDTAVLQDLRKTVTFGLLVSRSLTVRTVLTQLCYRIWGKQ